MAWQNQHGDPRKEAGTAAHIPDAHVCRSDRPRVSDPQ